MTLNYLHSISSIPFSTFTLLQKKKSLSICTHSRVQFPLHWLAYLYSTPQFPLQSDTCIQKQSPLQSLGTCIAPQFPLWSLITCILFYQLSLLTSTSHSQKNSNKIQQNQKRKHYKILVPTENATGEKLLFPSIFIFLHSIYLLLPPFSFLPIFLYFCLLSLWFWPRN